MIFLSISIRGTNGDNGCTRTRTIPVSAQISLSVQPCRSIRKARSLSLAECCSVRPSVICRYSHILQSIRPFRRLLFPAYSLDIRRCIGYNEHENRRTYLSLGFSQDIAATVAKLICGGVLFYTCMLLHTRWNVNRMHAFCSILEFISLIVR